MHTIINKYELSDNSLLFEKEEQFEQFIPVVPVSREAKFWPINRFEIDTRELEKSAINRF